MAESFRDEIYWWSLDLVKNGYKLQGIFLLLSTWNFAFFRYHMKTFDIKRFEKVLDKCDFEYFKNKKFETVDLTNSETVDKIKEIYDSLASFEGIRQVGATKILHLLNPDFFVLWDKKIMDYYKAKATPEGYAAFMINMQTMFKNGEFGDLNIEKVTIPRAIDIFNIEHYSHT